MKAAFALLILLPALAMSVPSKGSCPEDQQTCPDGSCMVMEAGMGADGVTACPAHCPANCNPENEQECNPTEKDENGCDKPPYCVLFSDSC